MAGAAITASNAGAQPVRSCPEGQAVNSLQPNGTPGTCLPIPNVNGIQAQISAEAAARMAADDALRASIPTPETSIVGRYAFTGNQSCLTSSTGFNDDLTPKATTSPSVVAIVQQLAVVTTGFRTFNADGSGASEFRSQTVSFPAVFYNSTGQAGITFNAAPPNPSGGASVSEQTGTFTWEIVDGKLIIADSGGSVGTIIKGGSRVGWSVASRNVPRTVGVLGKDLRIITIAHDDMQVETTVFTSPTGLVVESPRICTRERTLRKVDG